MHVIKTGKKTAGIRLWFFCTHMTLCTLCQWSTLCYCIHCCASGCALQISIAPCSPLPLPCSPRAFLMHLRLALLLVPPHSVEAEIMTWIAWLHCKRRNNFFPAALWVKGKQPEIPPFCHFQKERLFRQTGSGGADTKCPCCCWGVQPGCTAWISKLCGCYVVLLSFPFHLPPPLASK